MAPYPGWDAPIEWDTSGAVVMATDLDFQRFAVIGVMAGSAAADAGLAPGDVIVAVNGDAASAYSLPRLRELLKQDGVSVALEVERGAETRHVHLRLRRII